MPPIGSGGGKKILMIAGVVFLLILVAGGAYYYFTRIEAPQPELPADAITFHNGVFEYAPGNFSFSFAPGWTFLTDSSSLFYPAYLDEARFMLTKTGTQCVLAYVVNTRPWNEFYNQTSYTDRVFTQNGDQLDSYWWAPEYLGYTYSEARTPVPSEIRIDRYGTGIQEYGPNGEPMFVLFDADSLTVSDDCSRDVSFMLRSLKETYRPVTLTNESDGALHALSNVNHNPREEGQLLFRSSEDSIIYEVMKSAAGEYETKPGLFKGELYYVRDGIYRVDPFAKTEERVPGTSVSAGTQVNDYTIYGNRIWYLVGPACYGNDCNVEIRETGIDAPYKTVTLATNHPALYLMGYEPTQNRLFMSHGYGDAGCFNLTVTAYDFALQKIVPVRTYSGCSGEPQGAADEAAYNDLQKWVTNMHSVKFLLVRDGKLIDSTERAPDFPYDSGTMFRVFE